MDEKLQKNLRELEIRSNRQLSYPYILDRNPEMAATYLTIEDCQEAIKLIESVYKLMNKKAESKYTLLESQIINSRIMFTWFAKFYEKLIELEGSEENVGVPYEKIPGATNEDAFFIYPPLMYSSKKVKEFKFPSGVTSAVGKWRCMYIKKKVMLSEFREGYPNWYALSNMELYEEYNTMTNIRVRLNFIDGEFRYYIAGASDNWKEIRDVPLEMDHIISALLFRS